MPALLVLADAPSEITLSEGKATSWVQIGKTGRFSDPRYGKFSITESDFDKWIANFSLLSKADGRLGLPIDVDHSPEKKGETEAAGWITEVEKRDNGATLWAKAEWNDLGKTLVSDRRYAYLSPSFTANYEDETGKSYGTALLGVALTNRPFLSMATVTLSKLTAQAATEVEEDVPVPSDIVREDMPDLKKIALALKLPEDADEGTILSKLIEQKQEPTNDPVNLETLAQSQGKVLLTADQLQALAADAAAGREAQKTLAETTFKSAFVKAVDAGGMLPADEDTYKTLYAVKPDETLTILASAAERGGKLNVTAQGSSGAGAGGDLTTLASDMIDPLGQYGVDKEALKIHNRALTLSAEHKIDYVAALDMAEAEGVRA